MFFSANTGFVNVYGSDGVSSSGDDRSPKPLKAIGNLTTSISTLRFNHDSQLLAIASNTKKDQMRMVSIQLALGWDNAFTVIFNDRSTFRR
jgi:U3 small nucleolar RNA-associated protein 18